MKKPKLKKDMTVYDLAVFMTDYFDKSQDSLMLGMRTGFAEVNLRLAEHDLRFCSLEKEVGSTKDVVEKIDRNNKARLGILEDRTVVLKKVTENKLGARVAWQGDFRIAPFCGRMDGIWHIISPNSNNHSRR